MFKEAFNWIKSHGEKQIQVIEKDGRQYLSKECEALTPPSPEVLCLTTLKGLCDFVRNKVDALDNSKLMIHVKDEGEVHLFGPLGKVWRGRDKFACVHLPKTDGFDFSTKMDHENFMIALQIHFQDTPDLEKLLAVIGTMKAAKVQTSSDDGISQTVESSMGVTLTAEKEVPNPVTLRPFRTFRDLDDQPESKFVFRVHQRDDEMPKCALYEADGGAWVIDAMNKIAEFLDKELDKSIEIIN